MVCVFSSKPLCGTVRVPGDKSISHRTLILAALAEGRSVIRGLGNGADVGSTMAAVRSLGTTVTMTEAWPRPLAVIDSPGRAGLSEPGDTIDAGNSGTTARLVAGVAAGLPFATIITGDASLRRRPMGRVTEPLAAMGARISGRCRGQSLPLTIDGGRLRGIDWTLPVASAQVKSALILAALGAAGTSRLTEPRPTRDHTERLLPVFGGELGLSAATVVVPGGQTLRPAEVNVPGDPSSAAFFLTAAAATPGAEVLAEGIALNPGRVAFLEVLSEMGAEVEVRAVGDGYEPYGDVRVRPGRHGLRGVAITAERVPSIIDELPVLAVAACLARGRTVITGAGELRHKESDRLEGTAALLRLIGAEVEVAGDGLLIEGGMTAGPDGQGLPAGGRVAGDAAGAPLAAAYDCRGDHRLAMAAAVAACVTGRRLGIAGAGCVAISYPGFWRDLGSLGAESVEWPAQPADE